MGVQAAFVGDKQNNESVTRKKVEGSLFHIVLRTPESFIDVTDGDP